MLMEAALLAALATAPPTQAKSPPIPKYRVNYVKKQLLKKGLAKEEIEFLFNDERLSVKREPIIKDLSCDVTTWEELEKKIMSDESILRGKEYLKNNVAGFGRIKKERRINPEYIAALIRIESDFGNCLGNFSAFNVLYHNLKRSKWLVPANRLVALAVYCKKMEWDCHEVPGSSEGAIGLPQFMPDSLRFAEDGDGDGAIDLFNEADANMSSANFLEKHGGRSNIEKALARYYGSSGNYVRITLKYAAALKKK